jgi:cell wall-associated NlpC family hydrolase
VFFERGKVDHIGMYAGNGQWVVAPKTGDVVKLQDVDLSKATTIRRVVPTPPR